MLKKCTHRHAGKIFNVILSPKDEESLRDPSLALRMTIAMFAIVLLCCGFDRTNYQWSEANMSINDQNIIKVMTDPHHSDVLIMASPSELLTYDLNSGRSQKIFYANTGEAIVDVALENNRTYVLLATQKAVYRCRLGDPYIEKVFSFNKEDDAVTSVLVSDNISLIGTKSGLYSLKDGEKSWKTFGGLLVNKIVQKLTEDRSFLYVLTDSQLISINKFTYEQKVIFSQIASSSEETTEEDEEMQAYYPLIDVSVDGVSGQIVVAARSSVSMFDPTSKEWTSISLNGLPVADVNTIKILSASSFIAGTKRGVFLFENNEWSSIYQGMEASVINDVAMDDKRVYAATDRGLFYFIDGKTLPFVSSAWDRHSEEQSDEESFVRSFANAQDDEKISPVLSDYDQLKEYFSFEPSIKQVHAWAVDYAEVHPDKIKEWRRKAKQQAWLPQFDVGVDSGWDRTISDSVYGSYTGGGQHYIGPHDKSSGQDFGWDAGLSWDFSELIWNNDQTSIDSRSKMMVELREDILNGLTRIYFERRKAQIDLLQENFIDASQELQMQLRIDELTAVIDSLTGGEFSRYVERMGESNTEKRGVQKLSSWGRGSGVSSGG